MNKYWFRIVLFYLPLISILPGCSKTTNTSHKNLAVKGEYIFRQHDDPPIAIEPTVMQEPFNYPWETLDTQISSENRQEKTSTNNTTQDLTKINKYSFRCKGNLLNPLRPLSEHNEIMYAFDCGGSQRHKLPLKDNKEFIYPILIDLLNYLQQKTKKPIIITCGHCCCEHFIYAGLRKSAHNSKHLIGAEVDFYVRGMEYSPEIIVEHIFSYYKENLLYKNMKEFINFERHIKNENNLKIIPWYNKEIFVKILQTNEGRDFDNSHAYPYINIQVRFDRDLQIKVSNPN